MPTITISGAPGVGTTTVSLLLKEKLNLPYIYAGEIFRREAEKRGMSLLEFSKYCEENPEVDKKLDEYQKEILEKGNIILEGRLAGWIAHINKIPAFKVLLKADINTRIERILKREGGDRDRKLKETLERERSEAKRYREFYGIDINDESIYDLVIDTSDKTPEEIVDIIIEKLKTKGKI